MRSTMLVSALTMASRVLGLVRDQLFAALFGGGFFADAFAVAFRIPNMLRDLFAEGALSAAFVPTFARIDREQGRAAAYRAANKVIGAITLVVGALTVLGVIFAEPITYALARGFADVPGKIETTAELARIMMPFLLVVSLAAVTMGMLNARHVFGRPAIAPALFNVAAIVVGVGLWIARVDAETAVIGWAIGTMLGGVLQLTVQLPPLTRDGFSLWPSFRGVWRDETVRRIARLMAPATIGLAATQVNIVVNTQFASTQQGANAWLNYAFRLMYLPIGVFGVAVATVTTSHLAQQAANKDLAAMKASFVRGLKHVAFLTIPSTVGLLVLAHPLIGLLFERGRFGPADTQATAWALMGYALGLYAYSGIKVTAPAFYALNKTRVPLLGSATAVVLNLVLNLVAYRHLGYVGLALGTSLGALANLAILAIAFRRTTRGIDAGKGLLGQLVKVSAASLFMGAVLYGAQWELARRGFTVSSKAEMAIVALGGCLAGVALYALACRLLKVGEMTELTEALTRRFRRRAAT